VSIGRDRAALGRAVRLGVLVSVAILLLVASAGVAQTIDDRVYTVARQLMCPVCAGQTVAESDSTLAREMRTVIRQKLLAGATPAEILRYFVSQFGESVLESRPGVAWASSSTRDPSSPSCAAC
jgi:cytochrome c-type biogenesis protein CcmH